MTNLTVNDALKTAIDAHKDGRLQEADRYYTAILEMYPSHPDANHNMGLLAITLGKLKEALPFFQTAVEAKADVFQFWLSLIEALVRLENIHEARELLKKLNSIEACGLEFNKIEEKINKVANKSNIDTEVEKKDLNYEKLNTAIRSLRTMSRSENRSIFSDIAAVNSDNKFTEIKKLYKAGHIRKAIKETEKLLINERESYDLNNLYGVLNQALNKCDLAIKSYRKAINIRPDIAETHNNLGIALRQVGKVQQAIASYEQAIFLNPNYAEAYNNLGVALKANKQIQKALKHYQIAIKLRPEYAEAYKNIGNLFQEIGEIDKALESYKSAINIKPDYLEVIHMVSALENKTTSTAPRAYVENLFDNYAENFENSLENQLAYKAPEDFSKLLYKEIKQKPIRRALDIGCGTGLLGPKIKHFCDELIGVDLSIKMIQKAKEKNIYQSLFHDEVENFLSSQPLLYDLLIALDVFIYVGDLSKIFQLLANRNKSHFYFAFTTEHSSGYSYNLEKSGRYSHTKQYIDQLCFAYGYSLKHFSVRNLRKHYDKHIKGGYYLLERKI